MSVSLSVCLSLFLCLSLCVCLSVCRSPPLSLYNYKEFPNENAVKWELKAAVRPLIRRIGSRYHFAEGLCGSCTVTRYLANKATNNCTVPPLAWAVSQRIDISARTQRLHYNGTILSHDKLLAQQHPPSRNGDKSSEDGVWRVNKK